MPRYEFFCEDCQKPFEIILTLAVRKGGKITCLKSCGRDVNQEAAEFFAVTSKEELMKNGSASPTGSSWVSARFVPAEKLPGGEKSVVLSEVQALAKAFDLSYMSLSAKLITALPVVMVAAWMTTRMEGPWTMVRLLGLLLILVGLGVLILARIQFEKESSKQPGLVTRGVYSRIRHPIYLFSSIAFVGLLLYLNELQGILLLLPIQLILFCRARREEQELAALYGDQYGRYKQQTWF